MKKLSNCILLFKVNFQGINFSNGFSFTERRNLNVFKLDTIKYWLKIAYTWVKIWVPKDPINTIS